MPKAKRSAPSNRQQDEAAPAAKRQPGKKLATLDKNNPGSVDQIPVNEVLFVQDGFPLSFYVELCRDKKSLGELIFKHGGSLSKLITDCSSSGLPPTILASSEKSVREGFALPVFHSSYVQACISADKILSKHTFQIYPPSPPSPSSSSASSSSTQPPHPVPPSPKPSIPSIPSQTTGRTPHSSRRPIPDSPAISSSPARSRQHPTLPTPSRQAPLRMPLELDVATIVDDLHAKTALPLAVIFHALFVCTGDPEAALHYLEPSLAPLRDNLTVFTPEDDRILMSDEVGLIDRVIQAKGYPSVQKRLDFLDPAVQG